MCVANTGIVLSVDEKTNTAEINFHGNRIGARTGLVSVRAGDRVLVHAGCILQKVSDAQYEEWSLLAKELEDADGDKE